MDYRAEKQNVAGLGLVLAIHLVVGYALIAGLSRTLVPIFPRPFDITPVPDAPKPPPPEAQAPPLKFAPAPTVTVPVEPIVIEMPSDTITTPAVEPGVHAPPNFGTGPSTGDTGAIGTSSPVRREFKPAYRVDPIYPRVAQREGTNGRVIARVHVSPDGTVSQVQVVWSSHRVFEREVVRSLSQWKFHPEPVGFVGEYEIAFSLRD